MPTYEYKCSACGHAFERFHSMSATPITKCPECGKKKVKKLLGTGAGLIFKGSGFYITDYRDGGYKESAKNDSATPAVDSAKTDSTKTESKPAGGETKTATPESPKPKAAESTEKKSSGKAKD